MDQIIIENLQVYAHHGVYREENEKGQNFYINAVMETDTRQAGMLDDLDLSTNYGEVCRFLDSFLKEHTYQLIETVAEKTAEAVLIKFPLIRRITLEVRKPEAPVPLPFESISVKISRGWHRAYLSCGSNVGDREAHLNGAVAALRDDDRCRVLRVSDWIMTAPYGDVEQEDFLNGAIMLETLYEPHMLLEKLHEIEHAHGRERKVHWGPRTLDLDILLYEECIMYTDDLIIPHIDMQNRYFVLKPLAQIAPYERHPLSGRSILQLYEALMQSDKEKTPISGPEIWAEKLTLEQARQIYEDCAKKDFPLEEIKSFSLIEKMWGQGCYHAYGFYEKPSENESRTLCAYAFLLGNNKERVLLLDYFAVCEQKRGTGYGSRVLPLLWKKCARWGTIVIEVEDDELASIDEETRTMRKRRISFYTNAGCLMTATRSRVWGVDYRIMIMPMSDGRAVERLAERVTALYDSMYDTETMKKHFAITAV